jgi:DNA-binding NarL/FixJ family response regulator
MPSYGNPPLLVGRDRELGALRQHLAAAVAGHGGLVLIGGEAGIGKTALAESLCREAAERDALVFVGRCYDLSETPPYGPWLELFARYQPEDGDPPLPDAFARRGTVGAVTTQAALFQQVLDFFMALTGERSVVVLLDDAHWMDAASLDLLRFVGRSLTPLRLLLLATYRVDELHRRHPLYHLLPILVRETSANRLALRPLGGEHLAILVRDRLALSAPDAARLVAYLDERGDGNPFFVGELMRALEDEGVLRGDGERWTLGDLAGAQVPPLLRQVIDGRLARLDEDNQRLLAIAAVIGQRVTFALWQTVSGSHEEALLACVEQATAAHLIVGTSDGAGIRFVHALIREALYEGIVPLRRRIVHRVVGEALVALPHPDPDAVAYHLQQAGDDRAVEWLVKAGDRAEAAYAYLTAADRLEAALTSLDGQSGDRTQQGWLMLRLALLRRFADPRRSVALLETAASFVSATEAPALAAYTTLILGLIRCFAGAIQRGVDSLRAGVQAISALSSTEVPSSLPPSLMVALDHDRSGIGMLVLWLGNSGRYTEALRLAEPLVTHIPSAAGGPRDDRPHGDIYGSLLLTYAALGFPERGLEMGMRAKKAYEAIENFLLAGGTAGVIVDGVLRWYFTDDRDLRHRLERETERAWIRGSNAQGERDPRYAHIVSYWIEGHWQAAREALEDVRARGLLNTGLRADQDLLGTIRRLQGDADLAWQVIAEVLPDGPASEPGNCRFPNIRRCLCLAGDLALDSGDLATAQQWIEAHDRWLTWSGAVLGQSEGEGLWARYYRQGGNASEARTHAAHALAHARAPRQPLALIAAQRLLGELDTEVGHYEDAAAHFDAALSLADACNAPYERALILLALAALHVATSDTAAAVTAIDEVRAICTPLAAKPTLARADALTACLATFPDAPAAYPDGISAREAEVLRLLATGSSNQEIADTLSISVRTVERHITNLYAKIGADGRADATAYALHHHIS